MLDENNFEMKNKRSILSECEKIIVTQIYFTNEEKKILKLMMNITIIPPGVNANGVN